MDSLNSEQRSKTMAKVRSKDTKPELVVRRLVHGMGYRYGLHSNKLPGSPDLVFPKYKKVIFIHGCFWHRHSDVNCKLARLPKSRIEFWTEKLEGNKTRDFAKQKELHALGWKHLVIWECQLANKNLLKSKIKTFLQL